MSIAEDVSCAGLLLTHAPLFVTLLDSNLPGFSVQGFFRQEYWDELPFPPPGDLSDQKETELTSPVSPALQALTSSVVYTTGQILHYSTYIK